MPRNSREGGTAPGTALATPTRSTHERPSSVGPRQVPAALTRTPLAVVLAILVAALVTALPAVAPLVVAALVAGCLA